MPPGSFSTAACRSSRFLAWAWLLHLLTRSELDETIKGRNAISDFLYERFVSYSSDHFAWAKEIWDISAIAYLLDESHADRNSTKPSNT